MGIAQVIKEYVLALYINGRGGDERRQFHGTQR